MDTREETMEFLPPRNIEAEQYTIGALLKNPDMLTEVIGILKAEDFHALPHKTIYQAIITLFDARTPIDIVTVSDLIDKQGKLEEIGGRAYINDLVINIITTANISYYAKIVADAAALRNLIKITTKINEIAYKSDNKEETFEKAQNMFLELLQQSNKSKILNLHEFLPQIYDKITENYEKKGQVTGLDTGFYELNNFTGGFQASDLIIIAGRPSMGKTAFVLNIAEEVGIKNKIPVAFFSLEMSKEQLGTRLLSSVSEISTLRLRNGDLDTLSFDRITKSMSKLADSNLFIDDTPNISVSEIRAKCKQLQYDQEIGLVIIDYLQLMEGASGKEGRTQEISKISRGLKILARELNCPVIALSQLSRAVESRQNKRPMLSDLRESGAIEQDADLVLFLYRDEYYNPEVEETKGKAEVIVGKQRNGPTGNFELLFNDRLTKFLNPVQTAYAKR